MRSTFIRTIAELFTFLAGLVAGVFLARTFEAEPGDWLSFLGAMVGAIVAIIAAFGAVTMQIESGERQRLRTVKALLDRLVPAGQALREKATTDPGGAADDAETAYLAALAVATELRSHHPNIAIISQELATDIMRRHLERLTAANGGNNHQDATICGAELEAFAERMLTLLKAK